MKRPILILSLLLLMACSGKKSDVKPSNSSGGADVACGSHNGKQLYLGPQGGCYYYSSGGNKEYVSRGECSCNL